MSLTDQMSAMQDEVATLRELWNQVAAAQLGLWQRVTDVSGGSASGAAKTLLDTMQQAIATLDADRVRVYSGLRTYESWMSEAQSQESTLRSQLNESANYSLSNALDYTADQTADQLKKKVPVIAAAGLGTLVLVLLLVLAVKLA